MRTTEPEASPPEDRRRFRRNLVKVLTVQVVTLVLLWIAQAVYAS